VFNFRNSANSGQAATIVTSKQETGHHPSANLAISRYQFASQTIQRLRAKIPSELCFDIGAGDGRMKEPIEAAGMSWWGFDLAPRSPGITAWDLSAPCPLPGARAGVVMLLDVIEHLVNPGIALRHIAETLEPDGWLIMTMPNPRWSRSRIHALLYGSPACFTQSDLDFNGHVFTPWPHILIRMLHDAGLHGEGHVTLDGRTAWPGRPLSIRYPLRCAHAVANMLIERVDPSACGMSYGLVARMRCSK
jgi:SAM-dependent methyltransferase